MFLRLCQLLRRRGRDERGFTMVELMAVLIIIAVLIAGGLAFYLNYIDRAKVTKAVGQLNTMAAALDAYYAQQGSYPNSAGDAGVDLNIKDPWGISYSYTGGVGNYTLTAPDTRNNVRAHAKGTNGISEVKEGAP